MSGIAGIIHFDGRPAQAERVKTMTASMAHRGPDGIRHWQQGPVALGHCQLRNTPESAEEAQPLTNEDASLVLVMDGRVDNWVELRHALLARGAHLRTRADAELVLRAYEAWGEDCLTHMDGDFALVIWDAGRRQAFCARDRMGNKPFYWHWSDQTLVLASEPQAVLGQVPQAMVLDEGMVAEYLSTSFFSFTDTLWQGLKRLAPAHQAWVGPLGLKARRYWAPDLDHRIDLPDDDAYTQAYRGLLEDVVRRLSRSSHPLAFEVSGGLDSSAVFAMGDDLMRRGQLGAPGMAGYTLSFEGDQGADEIGYCRAVATHVGCQVHEVSPRAQSWPWYEATARRHLDFPDYPNGAAMEEPLAQAASAGGARVLLNGLGGDQWLCGGAMQMAEALQSGDWATLARLLGQQARDQGPKGAAWALLRYGAAPLLPKAVRDALRRAQGRWMDHDTAGDIGCLAPAMQELVSRRAAARKAWVPRRVAQRNALASLYDAYQVMSIELLERELAHHGLELRQPFWNHHMVGFALATPDHLRLRDGVDKWLHRRAMAGLLPPEVLKRWDKAEFSTHFALSLGAVPAAHLHRLLDSRGNWVDVQRVRTAYRTFESPDRKQWDIGASWSIWGLLGTDAVARQAADCAKTNTLVSADPLAARLNAN